MKILKLGRQKFVSILLLVYGRTVLLELSYLWFPTSLCIREINTSYITKLGPVLYTIPNHLTICLILFLISYIHISCKICWLVLLGYSISFSFLCPSIVLIIFLFTICRVSSCFLVMLSIWTAYINVGWTNVLLPHFAILLSSLLFCSFLFAFCFYYLLPYCCLEEYSEWEIINKVWT